MNRQIKFRGKRTDGGEWVYGDLFHNFDVGSFQTYIRQPHEEIGHDAFNDFIVIPETVGQFTGLCDKNKKEIYEGDIFRTNNGFVAVVEWVHDGRFLGFTHDRKIVYIDREPLVDILGNIHDNPDLLTAK